MSSQLQPICDLFILPFLALRLLRFVSKEMKTTEMFKSKKTKSRASKTSIVLVSAWVLYDLSTLSILRTLWGLDTNKYLRFQMSNENDDEWPKYDTHYSCS